MKNDISAFRMAGLSTSPAHDAIRPADFIDFTEDTEEAIDRALANGIGTTDSAGDAYFEEDRAAAIEALEGFEHDLALDALGAVEIVTFEEATEKAKEWLRRGKRRSRR